MTRAAVAWRRNGRNAWGTSSGPTVFVPVAQMGSPRLLALSLKNGATRWGKVLTDQPKTASHYHRGPPGDAQTAQASAYMGGSPEISVVDR